MLSPQLNRQGRAVSRWSRRSLRGHKDAIEIHANPCAKYSFAMKLSSGKPSPRMVIDRPATKAKAKAGPNNGEGCVAADADQPVAPKAKAKGKSRPKSKAAPKK